jgi:hypothetical protein
LILQNIIFEEDFMKKVIAVLMIMAVFSTSVFAAPLSVAGSMYNSSKEVSRFDLSSKTDALNDFDDLFADVQASALTAEEAKAVEGEGLFGWICSAIVGTITTAIVIVDLVQGNTNAATEHLVKGTGVAAGLALFLP